MYGAENSSFRNIKTWKLKIKITQEASTGLLIQTRVHCKMMWLALSNVVAIREEKDQLRQENRHNRWHVSSWTHR